MSFFKKISRYSLDPANILSYITLRTRLFFATAWSCLKLHTKAALIGVELDAHVTACGTVILHRWPDSRIYLGADCSLVSSPWRGTAAAIAAPVRLATYGPTARIFLGRGVELSGTSISARSTKISIGDYSIIAPNCVIVDSDFHAPWPAERRHIDPGTEHDKAVTLGKHVWLGMNCIVLKGVTIGDGAIIGAGSVVTRDIPPYCVAAGSPARVVKQLPPPTMGTTSTETAAKGTAKTTTAAAGTKTAPASPAATTAGPQAKAAPSHATQTVSIPRTPASPKTAQLRTSAPSGTAQSGAASPKPASPKPASPKPSPAKPAPRS